MSVHDENIRCSIKEYRRRKGLSQDELARIAGIRRQAVYDMESGRYLPNTAVALRLARALGCTVERLFTEDPPAELEKIYLLNEAEATSRLSLARVREKLVGISLPEASAPSFRLETSDALLLADKSIDCLIPRAQLAGTVLILGCDPALSVLGGLISRLTPGIRAHTVFAASRRALLSVNAGNAHVAGIHYHGSNPTEGNLEAVRSLLPDLDCLVVTFAAQEEGVMVAPGNPLAIRTVEDIANGKTRLANREEGAALRKLLDTQLARQGIPASAVRGYTEEVHSHSEGGMRVAGRNADAALGLRVVAKSFGLDFVPLAVTRCDLVIPLDLRDHPGVTLLLEVLQSSGLRKELASLPGYDPSEAGKIIRSPG
ncbi:MAG: helix-turn-helix domain-containing protein [Desulfovibrionaceae bacterium]|nr:helix-turn-helix domain-containing protein [Desulfovibrionaceae bacterium]